MTMHPFPCAASPLLSRGADSAMRARCQNGLRTTILRFRLISAQRLRGNFTPMHRIVETIWTFLARMTWIMSRMHLSMHRWPRSLQRWCVSDGKGSAPLPKGSAHHYTFAHEITPSFSSISVPLAFLASHCLYISGPWEPLPLPRRCWC